MSGNAHITGQIVVNPPITWTDLADKQHLISGDWRPDPPYWADAKVDVQHREFDTGEGVMSYRVGAAIVPCDGETSGYTLVASVQAIVDAFDAPGRAFTGFLQMVWGRGEETIRVHVVDGRAVEVKPQMVWPVGARDEDGAS